MRLTVDHDPIAKKRHRHTKTGMTYDLQKNEQRALKWHFGQQMRENGLKRLSNEPISMEATFHVPIPKSLSERKKTALEGMYCIKKPDLDNYVKFYSDVLNGIAYEDDNLISSLWCEKRYSAIPRVELIIKPLGGNMVNEHAITVKGDITMEELDYMVKKANRLGKSGREVVRVYAQEDNEGKHIYFEVEGLKPHVTGTL